MLRFSEKTYSITTELYRVDVQSTTELNHVDVQSTTELNHVDEHDKIRHYHFK